jgi:hypothetical protein
MELKISPSSIVGIIGILLGLIFTTLIFSSSVSVGSTFFTKSEDCTSCHYEIVYYEGWNLSIHAKENVTCNNCHSQSIIHDNICLECHDDYDLTNKTAFLWDWSGAITVVNPHDESPHIGIVECKECHFEHDFRLGKTRMHTDDLCHLCHTTYLGPDRPGF